MGVNAHHDPLGAELLNSLGNDAGLPKGHRAKDHPCHAQPQCPLNVRQSPQPSAKLKGNVHRGSDLARDAEIGRTAPKCSIEVYHVQPFGTLTSPAAGYSHRVIGVGRSQHQAGPA